MLVLCSQKLGIRTLRTKKIKWTKRYVNYSKSKRPSRKEKRALRRGLLKLLAKINEALIELEKRLCKTFTDSYWQRRQATKTVLKQQWAYFFNNSSPKHRIVSLDKPYIRPIVRGKEVKKVEFGAKVHKIQIDGISFIEHLSFDAFNEGIRLKKSIWAVQKLFKKKIKIVGADKIYANNKNRKYVTKNGIKTDFKRKGKPSKHRAHFDQLSLMITKERATRLEGSFGTDKEYFLLKRIKARTKETEILWLFFGIHTSNAIQIGQRMSKTIAQAA
ncbi:MAG: transposase [Maribacter sp.]|nr:transposase [Maribacter sp.]